MNLTTHYEQLWQKSLSRFAQGAYEQDALIDDNTDKRYGITLLARPDKKVKDSIRDFLSLLKEIEPDQYYYPASDIHITIMSIISCHEGFYLDMIRTEDYENIIQKSIRNCRKFKIAFKGITASPSCIMLQGFPEDETLNDIRSGLRAHFRKSNLQQSIDKRYTIQTAHSTVMRFRKSLNNIDALISVLKEHRNHDFGSFEVKSLELVYNDWYQREKFVKTLRTFSLDQ